MVKKQDGLQALLKYIFLAFVAAQLVIPMYMIITNETARRTGTEYKFRVEPADPYDPLRGRYVMLRFTDNVSPAYTVFNKGDEAYVMLTKDKDGFSVPEMCVTEKHRITGEYVRARITGKTKKDGWNAAVLEYPFYMLFMNEKAAPKVDAAFRAFKGTAYVTVYVNDGSAALGELYFDGVKATEYIKDK